MATYPPSSTRVGCAIAALLGVPPTTDRDEIRCQLLYHPQNPRYTIWVKGPSRAGLAAALTTSLKRAFEVSDDHWLLLLNEAEQLLLDTGC